MGDNSLTVNALQCKTVPDPDRRRVSVTYGEVPMEIYIYYLTRTSEGGLIEIFFTWPAGSRLPYWP